MRKIPTLFVRDPANPSRVTPEVAPGCEWVLAGEGRATRKLDGTACTFVGGHLHKRREVKPGQAPPPGFVVAGEENGKTQGWVPVGDGPEDTAHREALEHIELTAAGRRTAERGGWEPDDPTFELLGPKVQRNPEGIADHRLYTHGAWSLPDAPRTFAELDGYLAEQDIEGIVFHHPDGRMAKIKGRDFGHARHRSPVPAS